MLFRYNIYSRETNKLIKKKKKRETNNVNIEKGIEGKKMKYLEHRSYSLGTKLVSHRPIFLIFFFLFFFLLVCTSSKHLYRPKQPDFAGMASTRPVRPIFFSIRNKGCTCISALARTANTV